MAKKKAATEEKKEVMTWDQIKESHIIEKEILNQTFKIKDQVSRDQAQQYLNKLKISLKEVEAEADKLMDPLNAAIKEARRKKNEVLAYYETPLEYLKKVIKADLEEQARIEREKQAAIKEAEEKEKRKQAELLKSKDEAKIQKAEEKIEKAVEKVEQKFGTVASFSSITVRKIWKYEVEDFALLPDEYKQINAGSLKAAMSIRTPEGEPKAIPGVRFYQEDSI